MAVKRSKQRWWNDANIMTNLSLIVIAVTVFGDLL